MRFERQHEHERKVHKLFDRAGFPESSKPRVFYGFQGQVEVLHVLLSREEWRPGDERWHLSISGPGRVPVWGEIAEACHELRPGVPFVLGVPPRSMWMNLHEDVLHAWQTKDDAMLEQWKVNARKDRPT
jgi:hypothetical protein